VSAVQANAAEKVMQLTPADAGCSYFNPQLSENGRWVVAISLCTREIEDHQQVPDHQIVRLARDTGATQILTPPGTTSASNSVSGDGELVAFTSDGDLVAGQNPHHVEQLFLFDAVRHRYTQVTHLTAAEMNRALMSPRLSVSGETLVFVSNANLVAGENDDGNLELFVYHVKTGDLLQGTHTEHPAKHFSVVLSHDAQAVAFLGVHPPFGKRPVIGLYVWNRKTGAVELLLDTPYPDAGGFTEMTMSAEANRFVFSGKHDFVGENGDRNTELFIYDRAARVVRQLTHTRGCTVAHAALSGDGLRVVFVSDCRFGKLNEMLYTNLFLMRLDTDEVIQITDSGVSAPVEAPSMDASDRLLAVSFGAELNGMVNPRGLLQIALVNVPAIGPVAEVPPAMLSAQDLSMFLTSRHDPDIFYMAGPRFGVMKSENGGRSWRLAAFGLGGEHVMSLAEHPEKPRVLLAGTSDIGVYKTSDAGYIWLPANVGLSDPRILGLAFDTAYSEIVYADTPSGLFRSVDEGENWEHLTGPSVGSQHGTALVSLSDRPLSPSTGKLIPLSGKSGRLLRLSEHGLFLLPRETSEWIHVKTPHASEWAAVAPNGAPWFVGTSQGVYYTEQLDGEWTAVSGLPAASMPPVNFAGGDTVYAAARDGFYGSSDRGVSWRRLGDLDAGARMMSGRAAGDVLVSGFENGNLKITRDGGAHWAPITVPAPSAIGLESVLFRSAQ
jgi:Tol biopolymer transport system component/photosystem II stability/assembly factor-like uncharacterized protein